MLAIFCALLGCWAFPAHASADVRQSDIVAGMSVESRGLNSITCPSIVAEYAYVVDDSGKVYFERDADTQTHIASITKVMTALVALQYGDPNQLWLRLVKLQLLLASLRQCCEAGDTMTLESALKALMLPSGNDAAQVSQNR